MLRWVPLCLLGCVDEGGSQSEGVDVSTNETQICLETMTEVGMDESVFGFSSLADTVASVEVSGSVEGRYEDGGTTMVFLETRFDGGLIRHVESLQNPELSAEIDMGCVDRIEVEVDAELITLDDQLRVFRQFVGSVNAQGFIWLSASIDASDNTGSHDSDGAMYDVYAEIIEGQTVGEISLVSEEETDDLAEVTNEVLLTWPLVE